MLLICLGLILCLVALCCFGARWRLATLAASAVAALCFVGTAATIGPGRAIATGLLLMVAGVAAFASATYGHDALKKTPYGISPALRWPLFGTSAMLGAAALIGAYSIAGN